MTADTPTVTRLKSSQCLLLDPAATSDTLYQEGRYLIQSAIELLHEYPNPPRSGLWIALDLIRDGLQLIEQGQKS